MRALRTYGPGDVRLESVPRPIRPRPTWVTLAVEACGICGTDLEEIRSGPSIARTLPITLGHEVVGRVVEADDAGTFSLGDRVVVEGNSGCRRCEACLSDRIHLCPRWRILGLSYDGGLAEYLVAPAEVCIPVKDTTDAVAATLIEPLSVAVKAFRRLDPRGDGPLLIVGMGAIGLFLTQVAVMRGITELAVADPDPVRRSLAIAYGAALAVHPDRLAEHARDLGAGFDHTVDTSGSLGGFRTALAALRPGGTALTVSMAQEPFALPLRDLVIREQTIHTSVAHSLRQDFTVARDLLESGSIEYEAMLDDVVSLDEELAAALRAPGPGRSTLRTIVDIAGTG